jgi:hypothetical protein
MTLGFGPGNSLTRYLDIWFHRYRDGRDIEGRCMFIRIVLYLAQLADIFF